MDKFIKNLNKTKVIFWLLVGVGTLSLIFALQSDTNIKSSQLNSIQHKQESVASPSAIPTNKPKLTKVITNLETTSPTPNPSPTSAAVANNSQVSSELQISSPSTLTPTPTPAPTVYQINVSINGSSNYSISINEGANQCDVLSKSLEQGKISSLNMRFDSNYGSNAIYQINGLGKENSVWWAFKVNGISPSQGCSYIKANNGDNVLWEYKGS